MPAVEKKKTPAALPHRSLADKDAEIAALRTRTHWLLSALGLVLAFAAAVTMFAIKNGRPATPNAVEPEPPPIVSETPKPAAPKVDHAERERFLETFGSLSAAHLYQCYLSIGLLADNVESEAYSVEDAEDTMQSIAEMMDHVDTQLERLTKAGLTPEDRVAIDRIKAATALLGLQAHLLKEYWATGEDEDAERYHLARDAAWKGISTIMEGQ